MSATNKYTIVHVTTVSDFVFINGTVDTYPIETGNPIPVLVRMSLAAINAAFSSGGNAAVVALIAPQMLWCAIVSGLQGATNPVVAYTSKVSFVA
jgi:hypothetical protein